MQLAISAPNLIPIKSLFLEGAMILIAACPAIYHAYCETAAANYFRAGDKCANGAETKAASLWIKALDLQESPNKAYLSKLYAIGTLWTGERKLVPAEWLLKNAVRICEQKHVDLKATADGTNYLAVCLRAEGKFVESEFYFKKAIRLGQKLPYGNKGILVTDEQNLAELYLMERDYKQADLAFTQTLASCKRNIPPYGQDIVTAEILTSYGQSLLLQKRYAEAIPVFKKVLEANLNWYKKDSMPVAMVQTSLADAYYLSGAYAHSRNMCLQTLSTVSKLRSFTGLTHTLLVPDDFSLEYVPTKEMLEKRIRRLTMKLAQEAARTLRY
jgi:tetratricopeptide (TPR) repeat protein